MGKPRGSCAEASPSRGCSPTRRSGPCGPSRPVSRGALAVTPSRSVEPKLSRSGVASPAPSGTEVPSGLPPEGGGRFVRLPAGPRPFGRFPNDSGPRPLAGGWPGVNPVSCRFPGDPLGRLPHQFPSEPRLLRVPFRPCGLPGRASGTEVPSDPGDRLATLSGAFRPAEADPSAPLQGPRSLLRERKVTTADGRSQTKSLPSFRALGGVFARLSRCPGPTQSSGTTGDRELHSCRSCHPVLI
jgi:hypothetical protein